jgi:glycosyltransferase involved in cell wall biosynthesis
MGEDVHKSIDDVCVVTQPLVGASESATVSLLTVLSSITNVSLITANLSSQSELREKYDIVEISSSGTGEAIWIAAIRFLRNQLLICEALRRRQERIVLFFGTTSYLLPILYSRLSGKTVVLEPRGDVPEALKIEWQRIYPDFVARLFAKPVWVLEEICYRLAHGIVTLSPSMATDLGLERFGNKLHPNGAWHVDLDRFANTTPAAERGQTIGYLGRLGEEKGIELLVEAVKNLSSDVTFVFIGDGSMRDFIEDELVEEINLGRVKITGWVDHDEVPEYLNELRLLVLPSKTEGLPVTILEALACGTPVYARPVGGVPDVLVDGETGFLLKEQDPALIAERIERILSRDDLDQITQNGNELAKQEYSFEAAVNRYRKILTNIE